ncbi:MAG: hypothetical protein HQM08_20775 [Candidatus Riflebacteria bacterium]|nr:hypothetical protein [Candidatus Riflebacteria bacterium]
MPSGDNSMTQKINSKLKEKYFFILVAAIFFFFGSALLSFLYSLFGLRNILLFLILFSSFLIFHPLNFRLKIRMSLLGQKGEIFFSHFFGIVGLGLKASAAKGLAYLRIAGKDIPLLSFPIKPKKAPAEPKDQPPTFSSPDSENAVSSSTLGEPLSRPDSEPQPPKETPTVLPQNIPTIEPSVKPPDNPPIESSIKTVVESKEETSIEAKDEIPAAFEEPFEDKSEFLEIIEKPEIPSHETTSFTEKALKKLMKIFEKLGKIRKKIKAFWRIFKKIWTRTSQPTKRLLLNLWKSFSIVSPIGYIRYGLSEPHIVGMIQGIASSLAGILFPFGICLTFCPAFEKPSIYFKGDTVLRVYIHRLLFSGARLFFEIELWKGTYEIFLHYWKKRKLKSDSNK